LSIYKISLHNFLLLLIQYITSFPRKEKDEILIVHSFKEPNTIPLTKYFWKKG